MPQLPPVEGPVPLFCLDGNDHCFHPVPCLRMGRAPTRHLHDRCCFCRAERCRDALIRKGRHGLHVPESEEVFRRAQGTVERLRRRKAGIPLTPRRVQILKDLASGLRILDVAKKRNVKRRDVDGELYIIRKTLGVRSSAEAVAVAARNGWI